MYLSTVFFCMLQLHIRYLNTHMHIGSFIDIIGLFLCIFTQVCFAYYAHNVFFRETVAHDRPQCSDGNSSPLLKFLALCVFLSYGFGSEVMEGLIMYRWINCFPVKFCVDISIFCETSFSSPPFYSILHVNGNKLHTFRRPGKKKSTRR